DLTGIGSMSDGYLANVYNTIKKDEIETDSFRNKFESKDDKELMNACVEFESYFLKEMIKAMRRTVDKSDSFIPQSNAEEIFQDMLDDEYAKSSAKGSGIGLAKMMYEQLKVRGTGVTFEQIQNGEV
ncbi:MAG: rod-binding protein, partial [Firmicutes bacterium]|nr:rod-binding protein [Bacillota bacterium]